MPDHIEEVSSTGTGAVDEDAGLTPYTNSSMYPAYSNRSSTAGVLELYNVVAEDLKLLRTSTKTNYGSKLYNLKVDLKDL